MTTEVRVRPEAQIEFNQSIDWYEDRRRGLGQQFVKSIDLAIHSIAETPEQSAFVHRDVRCKSVKGFPYQIFYRVLDQKIIEVISIFHVRQHPGVWQSRS